MVSLLFFSLLALLATSAGGALLAAVVTYRRDIVGTRWLALLAVGALAGFGALLLWTARIPPGEDAPLGVRLGEMTRPHLTAFAGAGIGALGGMILVVLGFLSGRSGRRTLATIPILTMAISAITVGILIHNNRPSNKLDLETIQRSLPDGLQATIVVSQGTFTGATALAHGDDDYIYVVHRFGVDRFRLEGEGISPITRFSDLTGLGIAWADGGLLLSAYGRVLRMTDSDDDGRADIIEELASGFPSMVYPPHSTNGILVTKTGQMLLLVGGTSDHGPEEEALGGTVVEIGADGSKEVFATGLRNAFGIAECPDGRVFVTDNGPDRLDDRLTYRPPDEVNLLRRNADYGYPRYFGFAPLDSGVTGPVAILPMSAAAAGISCYAADGLGEPYRLGLFVALWGSVAIPEQTGRKVVWIDLEKAVHGHYEAVDFAAGFAHPIGTVGAPDGSLLVLDQGAGAVIRIRAQ